MPGNDSPGNGVNFHTSQPGAMERDEHDVAVNAARDQAADSAAANPPLSDAQRMAQLQHENERLINSNRELQREAIVLKGFLSLVHNAAAATAQLLGTDLSPQPRALPAVPDLTTKQAALSRAKRKYSICGIGNPNSFSSARKQLKTDSNRPNQAVSENGQSLSLTKVYGKSVVKRKTACIYRLELKSKGQLAKYLFVPNDSLALMGVDSWTHRESIPQEVLKMVENCLTTRSVPSEQYTEEMKAMKSQALQTCPQLTRWGLGSNKVRLVDASGMQELVSRLYRMIVKFNREWESEIEVLDDKASGGPNLDISWISEPSTPTAPAQTWTAPVYSRHHALSGAEDVDDTPSNMPSGSLQQSMPLPANGRQMQMVPAITLGQAQNRWMSTLPEANGNATSSGMAMDSDENGGKTPGMWQVEEAPIMQYVNSANSSRPQSGLQSHGAFEVSLYPQGSMPVTLTGGGGFNRIATGHERQDNSNMGGRDGNQGVGQDSSRMTQSGLQVSNLRQATDPGGQMDLSIVAAAGHAEWMKQCGMLGSAMPLVPFVLPNIQDMAMNSQQQQQMMQWAASFHSNALSANPRMALGQNNTLQMHMAQDSQKPSS